MSFPNLKYLILDSNMITSINNFPAINSLQTLSITNNNINDLSSFINAARTKYPQLRSVNTFRNPMNPGVGQPAAYNQYKSYMKQIGRLTELDGMNINDTSFMNQQQQQPKRDLFGTSTGQQPKRDLFGTTTTTTKVNFFDNPTPAPTPIPASQSAANSNAYSSTTSTGYISQNSIYTASTPNMNSYPQGNAGKPKMGLFDNMPQNYSNASQSTNMSNMFGNTPSKPVVSMGYNSSDGNTNGIVYKRQYFVIDESAEIDGTEFVNSKKKKSLIMINEKILKKSDNMTKFNRKNKSEGNKHILNSDL